jgi:hypothetical protein
MAVASASSHITQQRTLVEALFQEHGPLYGKKKILYPIRRAYPDGRTYDLKRYIRGKTRKEEAGMMALIQELGWPDRSPSTARADALYVSLKVVVEFDEVQHMDDDAYFNKLKPDYQRKRDHRINITYARQGYYVVRLLCADPVPDPSRRSGMRWIPVENGEVMRRTRQAVREVLKLKRLNMEQRGDLRGKVMVWPDLPDGRVAEGVFGASAINEGDAENRQPTNPLEQSLRRGTILAQEMAMQAARRFAAEQDRRTTSDEADDEEQQEETPASAMEQTVPKHMENELQATIALIGRVLAANSHLDVCTTLELPCSSSSPLIPPTTKPSAFSLASIAECLGGSSSSSSGTTQYERKWEAMMCGYSPQSTYEERVRKITLEVSEKSK